MPGKVEELMRTAHWLVTFDDSLRLLRVTRTPAPYLTEQEIVDSMHGFRDLKNGPARAALRLLLDVREGPLRNDDMFEKTMGRLRIETFGGFAAIAILVKTAVGRLQMTRMQREEGGVRKVFTEERDALAYLSSVGARVSPTTESPTKRSAR